MFKNIKEFETRLNLPEDFYLKLLEEDDWSFVIKLSALFEAACTHILAVRLRAPEIENALAHLEQGNTRYGKIVLLKKLGAITSEQSSILSELAKLRNELAHNVSNVSFTFTSYTKDMNKDKKRNFIKWSGHGMADEIQVKDEIMSKREFVLSNAKFAIWNTAAEVLACLYLEIESATLSFNSEAIAYYKSLTT